MPDPQLIQIKKYPNRRLYDRTRSCHLTHAELYDLVVRGHTISVTDSQSGADITNLVLAQALMEHSPEKFASFPPEVFHLLVRANDQLLRTMANGWFAELLSRFTATASPTPPPSSAPRGAPTTAPKSAPNAAALPFSWPFGGPLWPDAGSPGAAATASDRTEGKTPPAATPPGDVAALEARLVELSRDLSRLKHEREGSP